MDIHELAAFESLADTLHFARAAARSNLSPSALSRLVSRLEDEAGTALFERDTRQVALTPAGERYRAFARETLTRRAELQEELAAAAEAQEQNRLTGTLRLYASVTACYTILPALAERLIREHPALHLSISTGDPARAADAVRQGEADLAVSAIPDEGLPDLECWSVRKTPLVLAASSSGPWGSLDLPLDSTADSTPSPADEDRLGRILDRAPLILPRAGLARQRFNSWCRGRNKAGLSGGKPAIAAETAGNEALLALARLGTGLALVPRLVLENSPFSAGLVLYRTAGSFGNYDIGYIQRNPDSGPQASRRRRRILAALIKDLYPQ